MLLPHFLLILLLSMIVPSSIALASRVGIRVGIIGGGPSGFFAAISLAERHPDVDITILEASNKLLNKVIISGGGRCNLLPNTELPTKKILPNYPRGSKELISSYTSSITPSSVLSWFNDHGVDTKVESDGRTFPITDDSATVANALLSAARELKVTIQKKALVTQIIPPTPTSPAFSLTLKNATSPLSLDALIVATGSSRQGYDLLSTSFNHTIIAPVPSLFTLTSRSAVLHDLAGVSLPRVSVSVVIPKELRETKKQKYITQTGPVLITHNGLSGPAALKTSAFGARLLHSLNYEADLIVDWAPDVAPSTLEVVDILTQYRLANPKRSLLATTPDCLAVAAIPKRLWANLVKHAGIEKSTWAELNKKDLHHLAKTIKECDLEMTGKGLFKEEFVTAGGVDLKEVNMKSMASKLVKNLFIVGEALNVDAVTGGYNFLNCWTSGFTAGVEAGRSLEATETTEGR